jgi:hypothetical protein
MKRQTNIGYRIVEIDNEKFKTLFHGINGSRLLPKNQWIKAVRRIASEGVNGKKYISGFHVLEKLDDCLNYGKKFKKKSNRRIISLTFKNYRKKRHSPSPVLLADEIYISQDCEVYNLI